MTLLELFQQDVTIHRDVRYLQDGQERHRLDIYAPPDATELPVALWFYGGGWRSGDKRLFEHLGRALAIRGIITVAVNYRLTPAVQHPAHAEDCAAAVAWTYNNIASYGGNPECLFLTGHSAGAQLASLLALDAHYLQSAGVPANVVRGVDYRRCQRFAHILGQQKSPVASILRKRLVHLRNSFVLPRAIAPC